MQKSTTRNLHGVPPRSTKTIPNSVPLIGALTAACRVGRALEPDGEPFAAEMWLRCVCGLSLRAAMSSIIRWRSGLTVLVSLMGSSILSEVDEHLDSQDGALHPLLASFRLVKGLSALAPAQRAGAQRLCALHLFLRRASSAKHRRAGTKRTSQADRAMSVDWGRPEVAVGASNRRDW